jgi:hypothetical protein
MVCIQAYALSPEVIARARELDVWLMPWELQEDVTSGLILDLIDAEVGGFLTDVPDFVQYVRDLRCP